MLRVLRTLKILGKHFVIVSPDFKVIDANCAIQTLFVRMEANVRFNLGHVIVLQDFKELFVKEMNVIPMGHVSMVELVLQVISKAPNVNVHLVSKVNSDPIEPKIHDIFKMLHFYAWYT